MFKKDGFNVSSEYFKKENKKIASKSKQKCVLTDAEKVKAGTHKWVKEGKTIRLKAISNNDKK